MGAITIASRCYPLDRRGFLADPGVWDQQFAAAVARRLGLEGALTLQHLKVVLFVRRRFVERGEVARIFETCRACRVSRARLAALFPWGYQRGVCRLAGIPYEVIDRSHHALTYETVVRRVPGRHDPPQEEVPHAN